MILEALDSELSVCKVADYSMTRLDAPLCFTGSTGEERSLVCRTQDVPANATDRDDGWRAFRVAGQLDFSLIGILSGISGVLAESGIGIFAISTFDTDYVLTKARDFERALDALRASGYEVR